MNNFFFVFCSFVVWQNWIHTPYHSSGARIQQLTKIDKTELKRVLQSLACGKLRVLTKTPKGREVADEDAFGVNPKFENKHRRVKINQIQLRETVGAWFGTAGSAQRAHGCTAAASRENGHVLVGGNLVVLWGEMRGPEETFSGQNCSNIAPHCPTKLN